MSDLQVGMPVNRNSKQQSDNQQSDWSSSVRRMRRQVAGASVMVLLCFMVLGIAWGQGGTGNGGDPYTPGDPTDYCLPGTHYEAGVGCVDDVPNCSDQTCCLESGGTWHEEPLGDPVYGYWGYCTKSTPTPTPTPTTGPTPTPTCDNAQCCTDAGGTWYPGWDIGPGDEPGACLYPTPTPTPTCDPEDQQCCLATGGTWTEDCVTAHCVYPTPTATPSATPTATPTPKCGQDEVWDSALDGCRPQCESGEVFNPDIWECEPVATPTPTPTTPPTPTPTPCFDAQCCYESGGYWCEVGDGNGECVYPTPTTGPTATPTPTLTPRPTATPKPTPNMSNGEVTLATGMSRPDPVPWGTGDMTTANFDHFRNIANDGKAVIGGPMDVDVSIVVGPKARLHRDVKKLRLRLKELNDLKNDVAHKAPENHADIVVDLADASKWWKWQAPMSLTGTTSNAQWTFVGHGAPTTENNSEYFHSYCLVLPWNTTQPRTGQDYNGTATKLLGHNGRHVLQVVGLQEEQVDPVTQATTLVLNTTALRWQQVPLNSTGWSDVNLTLPGKYAGDFNVNVKNLVIKDVTTSAGTPDYFKFEQFSDDPLLSRPTVSFKIADDGDPHRYRWKLRVRSTDVDDLWTDSILISGIANEPGTVVARINDPDATDQTQVSDDSSDAATNATAYAPLTEWGTYTFHLTVEEVDAAGNSLGDLEKYRSEKLFIPKMMPDGTSRGHGGTLATDANGIEKYSIHYFFHDTSIPALPAGTEVSSMKIEMLPPDMGAPIASNDGSFGKVLEVGYYNKLLHTFDPEPREGGIYITLFMAEDTHKAQYRDHQNKRSLTKNDRIESEPCEVIEVTPKDATKVLISAKHGGGYPNPAQTVDGKITITARVQKASKGQIVYFEVIDPRDASSYTQSVKLLNDNADPGKSGTQDYASFQRSCLSARQVKLGADLNSIPLGGDVWKVQTTLLITNQYAGDNYQVRATGHRPLSMMKPFDQQPTEWGGSFKTSGLMIAWRRFYLQLHRMYKKGATITANFTPDADTNPDILTVDNTSDFKKDDEILLWNRDYPVVETTVTNVISNSSLEVADLPESSVTMPTGTTFSQFFPTYSGVRLKNSSETWDDVTRRLFPNAYGGDANGNDGGLFSEFVELQGWDVPKYTNFPNTGVGVDFCVRWFKYGSNNSNMFQLLAANQATGFSGVALPMANTATVCLGQDTPAFHEEASVHEIGHLCDLMRERPVISDHVDQAVRKQVHPGHTGTQSCVMSYVDQTDGITEFDMDCIRHARSQPDPE